MTYVVNESCIKCKYMDCVDATEAIVSESSAEQESAGGAHGQSLSCPDRLCGYCARYYGGGDLHYGRSVWLDTRPINPSGVSEACSKRPDQHTILKV